MKLRDLLREVAVTELRANPDMEIRDIRYDSRDVRPGDLFVAVEGFQTDGHRFIDRAAAAGAAAVLCQRAPQADIPYVLTPDSRKALAAASAALFGYPSRELNMIGVTGTNGKTTSTMLIKHMLEACLGAKVGLIGTISNYIGSEELPTERTTPESCDLQRLLRRMADAGCEYVVMEVSSHALALDRAAGIRFRTGLFTNLTQDHLDFHGTMENYAEAKSRLFAMCDRAAIRTDDPWASYMIERAACPVLRYGSSGGETLSAEDIRYFPSGVAFTAAYQGERVPVRLGIPGRFSVENALTTLAAGILSGIPLADAAAALATAQGVRDGSR